MKQIVISSETKEAKAFEKMEDKAAAASVSQSLIGCYIYFLFCGGVRTVSQKWVAYSQMSMSENYSMMLSLIHLSGSLGT